MELAIIRDGEVITITDEFGEALDPSEYNLDKPMAASVVIDAIQRAVQYVPRSE